MNAAKFRVISCESLRFEVSVKSGPSSVICKCFTSPDVRKLSSFGYQLAGLCISEVVGCPHLTSDLLLLTHGPSHDGHLATTTLRPKHHRSPLTHVQHVQPEDTQNTHDGEVLTATTNPYGLPEHGPGRNSRHPTPNLALAHLRITGLLPHLPRPSPSPHHPDRRFRYPPLLHQPPSRLRPTPPRTPNHLSSPGPKHL